MKTIRNSFYKNITFNNFLNAYYKTKLGKSYTKDILSYYVNYEVNLYGDTGVCGYNFRRAVASRT